MYQNVKIPEDHSTEVPKYQSTKVPEYQSIRVPKYQGANIPEYQGREREIEKDMGHVCLRSIGFSPVTPCLQYFQVLFQIPNCDVYMQRADYFQGMGKKHFVKPQVFQ